MTSSSVSSSENNLRQIRLDKLEALKTAGIDPYPEKYQRTHTCSEASKLADELTDVSICGRIMLYRSFGKLAFATIKDETGRMQVAFTKQDLGEESFKLIEKNIDVGDFIGVVGDVFTTKHGEKTILAKKWTFLGKALRPLPEKFHGIADEEVKYRQRYLDMIMDDSTLERFKLRSNLLRAIREFYFKEGFYEVETPSLLDTATGAAATPYNTHNNALDIDLVLRISHELPLKMAITGGFEKIFEIGKAFRNEGIDPSHLPEHTHIEHYCAYWNFENNMKFTEQMFDYIFDTLNLSKKVNIKAKDGSFKEVDFTTPWKRVDYIELLKNDTGIDITEISTAEEMRELLKAKKIDIADMDNLSYATLVDYLYKKISRPKIVGPVFLYNYPKALQPLARVNDHNSNIVDQFQLVVNGWEIVKAYSELVDPIDQAERFLEQAQAVSAGDNEAMQGDDAYITCMEYGMPPISGWGMGFDRLITLLTSQDNLRDNVLFPMMRQENPIKKI